MSRPIIEVDGLSKRYRLGQLNAGSLREEADLFLRRLRGAAPPKSEADFWALRDVSFQVQPGEVVGVIGRNGAGKSTLLKILSRVTEPTSGEVRIRGRVASLLEVGTGFHPELTGRENIYLNGAILGMTRAEIAAKFDEIVDFSGVEQFIDTPVKRYSSGMYVRLAFAVAAHLEPEILVVDEVLAVGDAEFQKKCLGKMQEVSGRDGRTVLFVSHNMAAVKELCTRALLVESGRVLLDGSSDDVVGRYLSAASPLTDIDLARLTANGPHEFSRLHRLQLFDGQGRPNTTFQMGGAMRARILLEITCPTKQVEVGLKVSTRLGSAIHYFTSSWEGVSPNLQPGFYWFEVTVPDLKLYPGTYVLGVWVLKGRNWSDSDVQEVGVISVLAGNVTPAPNRIAEYAYSGGEVHASSDWSVRPAVPARKEAVCAQ
jgi:lipopolysaccharide transport system ATP-binding protein